MDSVTGMDINATLFPSSDFPPADCVVHGPSHMALTAILQGEGNICGGESPRLDPLVCMLCQGDVKPCTLIIVVFVDCDHTETEVRDASISRKKFEETFRV